MFSYFFYLTILPTFISYLIIYPFFSHFSCPRAWVLLNGTFGSKSSAGCYHFGSEQKNQTSSHQECKSRSGYLVEISNQIEHRYLSQKLQEIHSDQPTWNTWWIGLRLSDAYNNQLDETTEGSGFGHDKRNPVGDLDLEDTDNIPEDSEWNWLNSGRNLSNQTYTGWSDSSTTNNLNGNCVTTDYASSWLWKSSSCSKKHFFICEIDGIQIYIKSY